MNDRMLCGTWEQQVEYKKVHQWGQDFNKYFNQGVYIPEDITAQEILESC